MLARVVKDNLTKILKQEVRNIKYPGEPHYKTKVIDQLNMLLGISSGRNKYWEVFVLSGLQSKFGVTTTVDLPDFHGHSNWKVLLLKKVSTACALCWDKYFYPTLESKKNDFFNMKSPIAPMALTFFKPLVKRMNVGYVARAYLLKVQVNNLSNTIMLNRTISIFQAALLVYTHDKHALVQLGHLYQLRNENEMAEQYFIKALEIDPHFEEAKTKYKYFLESKMEKN